MAGPDGLRTGHQFLLPVARTLEASFLKELIASPIQTRQAAPPERDIHLVPEALPCSVSLPRWNHCQRHGHGRSRADGHSLCDGLPRISAHLRPGQAARQGSLLCHGQPDCGEEVVPELVQHKFTAENIVTEMNKIIPDGEPRTRMIERLAAVKVTTSKQGSGRGLHPSDTAAEIILKQIDLR